MAPIYEEITLSWEGKDVVVRPTFKMVQRIEAGGISIFGVYQSITRGEPRVTQIAEVISALLISGGAKSAIPELVYQRIVHATSDEWERIAHAIFRVFMPPDTRAGNSEGPEDGADT